MGNAEVNEPNVIGTWCIFKTPADSEEMESREV